MDSGSKAQKTSSPRKLAECFRESLVFQEAPIAFPEYLYLEAKLVKCSLFLKHGLYSALVCSSASAVDVFISFLLTLAVPGTPPARQLFGGGFFLPLPSPCTFPSC